MTSQTVRRAQVALARAAPVSRLAILVMTAVAGPASPAAAGYATVMSGTRPETVLVIAQSRKTGVSQLAAVCQHRAVATVRVMAASPAHLARGTAAHARQPGHFVATVRVMAQRHVHLVRLTAGLAHLFAVMARVMVQKLAPAVLETAAHARRQGLFAAMARVMAQNHVPLVHLIAGLAGRVLGVAIIRVMAAKLALPVPRTAAHAGRSAAMEAVKAVSLARHAQSTAAPAIARLLPRLIRHPAMALIMPQLIPRLAGLAAIQTGTQ